MNTITRNLIAFLLFTSATGLLHGQSQTSIKYGHNKEAGNYKKINGINIYYEVYGTGKPLIFLHGSGGSLESAGPRIEYFKKYFKVIAIDSRAHGKSIDTTTRQLTYVQMANDIKVLLDSLHIDSAFVQGQSDGGILGLLLAINYPGKIAKLAAYGANIFPGKKAIFDERQKTLIQKDSFR
jgi:pimeloyl-ACP methyl ester carboxylesterase